MDVMKKDDPENLVEQNMLRTRGTTMKNTKAAVYRVNNGKSASLASSTADKEPVFNMDERIYLLANRLSKIVEFDSFEYESQREGVAVALGNVATHKCNYKIKESGRTRGEFTLTRNTPFKEEELMIIETAMSSIIHTCHL